jgi:hypothetical protein
MTESLVKTFDITYNTRKENITISEYGRTIQGMILKATELEDDEHRQAYVETIVDLMLKMHPQTKNVEDYVEKIWRHVFRIAQYNLKGVVPPSSVIPSYEEDKLSPEKVDYPTTEPKFRHYGHYVQELIKKALEMEEGPIKQEFVRTIGNYMKLAYLTWNKEHFVSDHIILDDLRALSKGKLTLEEDVTLSNVVGNPQQKRPIKSNSSSKGQKRFQRSNTNNTRKKNRYK